MRLCQEGDTILLDDGFNIPSVCTAVSMAKHFGKHFKFDKDAGLLTCVKSEQEHEVSEGLTEHIRAIQVSETFPKYKGAIIHATVSQMHDGDQFEVKTVVEVRRLKTPWSFCETPEEKCTMNYCDENGCQNRKRCLVDPKGPYNEKK